jgi:quinoprotein glucose dehydrogenase
MHKRTSVAAIAVVAWGLTIGHAAAEGDWPSFGNDPGGSQYSPLNQITPANVDKLKVAWMHKSGDVVEGSMREGGTSLQVTPIHVNDTVYYCTPLNRVIALDPATGAEKWIFDPHGGLIDKPRRAGNCRGVAYWEASAPEAGQPCQKRIFRGDGNGFLYAIDADTGKSCADFGAAKGHAGYASHHDYPSYGEGFSGGMSSPPLVIGDVVVATSAANDGLVNAADGVVRGFDVRTGELKWEFNPIPPEGSDKTGAANVWTTMSADPARNLVFLPTSSPSPDYYGVNRPFDIPLGDATVAVDATTGEVKWSYQAVRHDLFDYDLPGHPLLVTIRKDGQPREVAIQQTKMGYMFVLDRETGQPIAPVEDRPVPKSTIPGENASPTQPFPTWPATYARTSVTREEIWGVTPLDRAWCRREFDKMRYEGMFTPPGEQEILWLPAALGGGNWGGASYDPVNNLLVIKADNLATRFRMVKRDANEEVKGIDFLARDMPGTPYRVEGDVFWSPLGIPCIPPPWGQLTAIDMDSGKVVWQIPLGQSRKWGFNVPEFFGWGSITTGGPITTAGGLVFIGATLDHKFRALDVKTGEEVWEAKLPAPAMSVPMTYMANGKQFVVISAGGSSRIETARSDAIIAYTLDE